MAIVRKYIGIENLSLTSDQRDTLVDGLKQLGANTDPSPARRNHWRVRLDGDAAILEAAFDDSLLTVAQFKTRLAGLFGVDPSTITSSTANPSSGTLITFTYQAVARFRLLLFGGSNATYQQSGDAARAYLAANAAAWESSE